MITVRCADAFSLLSTTSIVEFTPPAEKSGARVDRILGLPEISFPADPAPSIATGVANLSAIPITAQTPLNYINKIIETAEQGRFYVSRSGVLTFEERTAQSTDTTPTIIFSDEGTEIPYETLEVIYE